MGGESTLEPRSQIESPWNLSPIEIIVRSPNEDTTTQAQAYTPKGIKRKPSKRDKIQSNDKILENYLLEFAQVCHIYALMFKNMLFAFNTIAI